MMNKLNIVDDLIYYTSLNIYFINFYLFSTYFHIFLMCIKNLNTTLLLDPMINQFLLLENRFLNSS